MYSLEGQFVYAAFLFRVSLSWLSLRFLAVTITVSLLSQSDSTMTTWGSTTRRYLRARRFSCQWSTLQKGGLLLQVSEPRSEIEIKLQNGKVQKRSRDRHPLLS